jgi:hypothetical protein
MRAAIPRAANVQPSYLSAWTSAPADALGRPAHRAAGADVRRQQVAPPAAPRPGRVRRREVARRRAGARTARSAGGEPGSAAQHAAQQTSALPRSTAPPQPRQWRGSAKSTTARARPAITARRAGGAVRHAAARLASGVRPRRHAPASRSAAP